MKKSEYIIATLLVALVLFAACSPSEPNGLPDEVSFVREEYQPKVYEDGIYTVSQSSGDYTAGLALPSDEMMVFGNGYDKIDSQVRNWLRDSDYGQIDIFIPIGRDFNSYYVKGSYDGRTHYEIVQTSKDGNMLKHPTGDTYYTLPSPGFVEFLTDYAAIALRAGATDVYLEEPDGFTDYIYCDYFKAEWQKEYGDLELNPYESDDVRYKADKLVAKIFTDAMDGFSGKIKEMFPDTKVYICTHSSLSYSHNPISSNNYDIVNLPNVDGLIAQCWTDTAISLMIDAEESNMKVPFEAAYSEYSELYSIAEATGKKYYSLSDPAADGAYGFDYTRSIYELSVTAQLLQPKINSFQISIWPDRSFGNADATYKRIQQQVFACMNEVTGLTAVRESGTTGIGLLMSYNACSNKNPRQVNNYVQSVNIPLLNDGIPVDVLLLEALNEEMLSSYKVIFLSYNYIKPENAEQNRLLADYVAGGGTLVYLDGGDNKVTSGFWEKSPAEDLFGRMGIDYDAQYSEGAVRMTATGDCPSYFTDYSCDDCRFASLSAEGGRVYLRSGDSNLMVGYNYGSGNVLVLGIDSNALLKSESGRELVRNMAEFAVTLYGEEYIATGYLKTTRGNYVTVKTYDTEYKLEGTYVNLFDNDMKVLHNPVVQKNGYGLYKRLENDGVARVFVANCRDVTAEEVDNVFSFDTKTIYLSDTCVLLSFPYVNYSDVRVYDSVTQTEIEYVADYDEENKMLKLTYNQSTKNAIRVEIDLVYD